MHAHGLHGLVLYGLHPIIVCIVCAWVLHGLHLGHSIPTLGHAFLHHHDTSSPPFGNTNEFRQIRFSVDVLKMEGLRFVADKQLDNCVVSGAAPSSKTTAACSLRTRRRPVGVDLICWMCLFTCVFMGGFEFVFHTVRCYIVIVITTYRILDGFFNLREQARTAETRVFQAHKKPLRVKAHALQFRTGPGEMR